MKATYILSLISLAVLHTAFSEEKVLFGEPTPIGAEGRQSSSVDAAKEITPKDGRKGRVFTFPGSSQQQDPRTHQPAYVISSPYEETQDRFSQASSAASAIDENRLLSLLPTFGSDGMQVGLDFKLPFFSVPYAKMFSALASPSIGSGLFGNGLGFGGSPSISTGTIASNLLGTGSGSGLATMAAMAVTAALLYPKVSNIFSLNSNTFRDGGGADDFFHNVNSVLNQFNIDGESCMKMALCSLGNTKRYQQRTSGRDGTTTPADVVEDIINLPVVKKWLVKGALTQARDFGGSGGDCEYFNEQNKCPVAAATITKMLSSLGGN
ncbi:uncharacterized protein [Parasteatoda tepidariorum]|uniref:uncharacterized protein n=1 Tax=Parasteatoda tepidariorum TaxID=114398 RepID=UPI00077FA25B